MLEIAIWFAPLAVSVGLGAVASSRWAGLAGPVLAMLIGLITTALEPPNYDMHGFGIFLGVVLAVACVVGWLLARSVRAIIARNAQA